MDSRTRRVVETSIQAMKECYGRGEISDEVSKEISHYFELLNKQEWLEANKFYKSMVKNRWEVIKSFGKGMKFLQKK